jgi:V8-like Glu-specific endopeptidase
LKHRLAWLALLLPILATSQAVAQTEPEDATAQGEEQRFLEILKSAPPAPVPPPGLVTPRPLSAESMGRLVAYDPATDEQGTAGPRRAPGGSGLTPPAVLPHSPMTPREVGGTEPPAPPPGPAEGLDETAGVLGTATPPSPYLFTHDFPFNTTYKLLMRFPSGGSDFFYVCSASSMGSFHLLTAGHCLYNHDPNNDGSTADAGFAAEVWAWAAQTDLVNPFGDPDHPYSFAKGVFQRTYVGWSQNADFDYDMAFLTLDRRDGTHTGWMGREAGMPATSLNFNGYPTEQPYVPPGEVRQYPGFDPGNVDAYTAFRILMSAFTYGGHSGGPVWRFDGTNRFVQGVNSTSNRAGSAAATLITSTRFNDITAVQAEDEAVRPPLARPDLAEYVFTTVDDRKDLLTNTVPESGSFQVEYNVFNTGFAPTGTITVEFYLSTNAVISTFDTLVGTLTLSSLDEFFFVNPVATLPANVAPGTYFVGWILRGAVAEYGGDGDCNGEPCSNVVVIADETLTVTACGDAFEPDDSAGQASVLTPGAPQSHSLCPVGDEDWAALLISQTSEVIVETSGVVGDTRMWLYDSGLNPIELDDDDGAGLFSRIDRLCGIDPLPPGTYFVQVDEFGDDNVIDAYDLSLTTSACGGLPALIFADGFETGDTSRWSIQVP